MDCKLLAKEVLIEDDDFVIECKLSAEIKLPLFYWINYQLCSFLVLCINLNVFFQNGVRETLVFAGVGNLGLLAWHLKKWKRTTKELSKSQFIARIISLASFKL